MIDDSRRGSGAGRRALRFLGIVGVLAGLTAPAVPAAASLPARAGASAPAAPGGCATPITAPTGPLDTVAAQSTAGVYLWLDQAAWHVRFTHPGSSLSVLTGQIRTCTPVHLATYLMQDGDEAESDARGTALRFSLYDTGQLDGFEFNASCPTTVTFSFSIDGSPAAPSQVFIGASRIHPDASTFALPSCSAADLGLVAPLRSGDRPALLELAGANAAWRALSLPLQAPLLYGSGDTATSSPAPGRRHGGPSLASALTIAGEVALGAAVLGAGCAARRQRRPSG